MGWDSPVSFSDLGDTLPKRVIKKELLASVSQVASAAASLIINKLLMVSNCDTSHQNEISNLAQLTLEKCISTLFSWFKIYTVHVVVFGGEADLAVQFKGRVLLHQCVSLRSIDWSAPWHRNNICELLKWVAFFPFKEADSTLTATAFISRHAFEFSQIFSWLHDCFYRNPSAYI